MVRNSILIFCLRVCFCQYHISVSLYTHLYTHIINKLLHGWFVWTIFIVHSLRRIAKLTRSLRSLVRLMILHNSWIKIVRTHQPWSNLYVGNNNLSRRNLPEAIILRCLKICTYNWTAWNATWKPDLKLESIFEFLTSMQVSFPHCSLSNLASKLYSVTQFKSTNIDRKAADISRLKSQQTRFWTIIS